MNELRPPITPAPTTTTTSSPHMATEPPYLYTAVAVPIPQGIPTEGPASHPDGPPPRDYTYEPSTSQLHQPIMDALPPPHPPLPFPQAHMPHAHPHPHLPPPASTSQPPTSPPSPALPSAAGPAPGDQSTPGGPGANHYPSSTSVPRLPPILQVEKQQVTTSATQLASASRRRNEAHFVCPVPGCGSTFTRRFNLRGHLRSHTEERPYVCEWPGCKKGFARQHDCKRHQALHAAKSQTNICLGCKKTFSRLDALNRHLRSDGGADCRSSNPKYMASMVQEVDPSLKQSPNDFQEPSR
jgi:uncharacterized Zn-finger protein